MDTYDWPSFRLVEVIIEIRCLVDIKTRVDLDGLVVVLNVSIHILALVQFNNLTLSSDNIDAILAHGGLKIISFNISSSKIKAIMRHALDNESLK